jgi:DNA-binding transcriptional regulator YdaS (Cro superfamily)
MKLKQYLRQNRISVNAFAKRIGHSQPGVWKWVNDVSRPQEAETYQKIFIATKGRVTANDFWGISENNEEALREVRVNENRIRQSPVRLEEGSPALPIPETT